MKNIIRLLRPYQWIKNVFIFLPMFFGGALTDWKILLSSIIAFFAYSFAASSIYCYNDILDVEYDRKHSKNCKRPIASGAISIFKGYVIMVVIALLSAAMTLLLGERMLIFGLVLLSYYALDILYCRYLKHYAIVDVCVLSFGFVLRILAGSAATNIVASHWLVLMTFLLALLLSFAKRRDDVVRMLATGEAPRHNTNRYNLTFLNQTITVNASVTLVCYIMYTLSPEVFEKTNFKYGYLTTILVLLGLLRYMQLTSVDNKSGDPTRLIYSDRFLQIVILCWLLSYLIMIYII